MRAPEARAKICRVFCIKTSFDVIIFKFQGVQVHPLAPSCRRPCSDICMSGYLTVYEYTVFTVRTYVHVIMSDNTEKYSKYTSIGWQLDKHYKQQTYVLFNKRNKTVHYLFNRYGCSWKICRTDILWMPDRLRAFVETFESWTKHNGFCQTCSFYHVFCLIFCQ